MIEETIVDNEFIELMDRYRIPDKTQGFIEACSQNVVLFAEKMLGIRLYSWQVDFLTRIQKRIDNGEGGEFLALTSRQIGKTTSVAILSLWATVFNKKPEGVGRSTSVLVVSASDDQAKKLLREIKKLIVIGDTYIAQNYREGDEPIFGRNFFSDLLSETDPNNTTTITFKSYNEEVHGEYLLVGSSIGSTIKSYPPTSKVLGETAGIGLIDEAGRTDKISDDFYKDIFSPIGTSTDAIFIYTSTPWTSSGFFYRKVDPDDQFPETAVDGVLYSIDAIKEEGQRQYDTVQKKYIEPLRRDGDLDTISRAYYCRFVKGTKAYFDPDKVRAAFTDEYQMLDGWASPCDMGVDFGGQVTSKTVITISEFSDEGIIRRLYHKVYDVGHDDKLIEDMESLMTRFNIQRIIPDDCPAGQYLIKQMVDKGWDIQPMNFRTDKIKKYGAFRASLNRGAVKSYQDEELQTEMLALEFDEGRKQSHISHAPGYTDDRIDSFLMSCYFFVQEEGGFKAFDWGDEE